MTNKPKDEFHPNDEESLDKMREFFNPSQVDLGDLIRRPFAVLGSFLTVRR